MALSTNNCSINQTRRSAIKSDSSHNADITAVELFSVMALVDSQKISLGAVSCKNTHAKSGTQAHLTWERVHLFDYRNFSSSTIPIVHLLVVTCLSFFYFLHSRDNLQTASLVRVAALYLSTAVQWFHSLAVAKSTESTDNWFTNQRTTENSGLLPKLDNSDFMGAWTFLYGLLTCSSALRKDVLPVLRTTTDSRVLRAAIEKTSSWKDK